MLRLCRSLRLLMGPRSRTAVLLISNDFSWTKSCNTPTLAMRVLPKLSEVRLGQLFKLEMRFTCVLLRLSFNRFLKEASTLRSSMVVLATSSSSSVMLYFNAVRSSIKVELARNTFNLLRLRTGERSSMDVPEMSNQLRSDNSLSGSREMISRIPEMSTRCFCVTSFSLASSSEKSVRELVLSSAKVVLSSRMTSLPSRVFQFCDRPFHQLRNASFSLILVV